MPSSDLPGFFEQYDAALDGPERRAVGLAREFCGADFAAAVQQAFVANAPFDRALMAGWARLGLLGLQVAPEHGGLGASYLCKIRVAQEMARHGFAAAFCLNNMQGIATRLSRQGSAKQQQAFLAGLMDASLVGAPAMTEPQAGSDLGRLACQATPVPGGWLLNGSKAWVTNGTVVDLVTALARVPAGVGDKDMGGKDEGGVGEIASFLVSVQGATVQRQEIPNPGARSFRLAELHFNDHFMPDWALFQAPGAALKASLQSINAARVHVAAMCVATLHGAFTTAVRYCGQRVAFGSTLLEHQGLRWSLADVATSMEAANALVYRAAAAVQRGADVTVLAAQAKVCAVQTAVQGIQACMQAMGAVGASAAHPLAMHAAETRLAAYADGTSEMLRERTGKSLARAYAALAPL